MMRSILVVLAAAVASAMLPMNSVAADYELKGFTTATFQGNQTVRNFTEACQAELGSDTRMCNSVEVMETVNWPSLPTSKQAWMRPVFVPLPSGDNGDASGTAFYLQPGELSCDGWTSDNASFVGLTLFSNAASNPPGNAFANLNSCSASTAVACCGPVPQPSMAAVPAIMWFGRGLLAAILVSAAAGMLLFRGRPLLASGQRDIQLRR